MAPKAKGKGKAGPPPQQPKTLSSRVRQVVEQQKAAEEGAAEQQEELVVPIQMAFTSLISTSWSLKRSSAFCMINNYCNAAPLWRDSFFVSLESSWLEPPLHKYVRPKDADLPEERLMVQLWRESSFRERLQLGYKLLYEHNDAAGAAMLLFDIAPSHFSKDWVTRIQLACAAYKQAWRSRSSDNMEARQLREGGMALEDVRWLRAQWLLARVLCAALGQTNRRTSGLLSMVTSALVGLAPEDPMGGRFLVQRSLVGNSDWDNLDEATAPVSTPCERFENLPHNVFGLDTSTMATAYNRALACYHCYGPEDSITLAAVKAALELDPARWVPLLLAGGALAVPGRPPLVALGSKEEASAYCMEFGNVWWLGSLSQDGLDAVLSGEEDMEQPEPVTWLLEQAGLDDLAGTAANMSHLGVVNFNLGLVNNCMACCLSVVVDEMNVRLNVSMSVGTSESSKPESCPSVARSCLAFMCCLGSASQNLPPVDTCDTQLWAPAARMWGLSTRELAPAGIKTRVSDTASVVFDIAQRLIAQCRVWWQQAQRGELQGGLSLLWGSELQHWERTMEELRPARARMFWQAGQVRTAKDVAAELLEQQEQLHAKLQSQLSTIKLPAARDAALAKLLHGKPTAPGPVLHSLAAIRDLQEFLNQQALEAARRTLSSRTRGGARGGSTSTVGSLEAPAVQYQRYEEATAEALKRFTTAVLDAVGGQASINAALNVGQLLQAYGRNGSSSQQDSESESDEDDDAFGGKSRAEVGISVIEQLLTSQMPLTSPGAAAAAAGPGGRRVPAASQQQLHQAAGISTGSTSSSGSRTEPSIVAALRATLRSEETPDWLTGMSAGLSHSAGCSCCCPHMDFVREALQDPAVIKAALVDIMRSRGVEPGQTPGAQAAIDHLAGQLPKLMVQDTGEGPGSSSGSDGSRPLGQRQVRQRTAEPGGESGLSGTAAEAVATFQAAIGAAAPAGAGQGGDTSAHQGTAAKATTAALLQFAVREGKGPFEAEDPGPGFVFGSNPEAAAAAASAAFDSVLKSYTAPAQQSAAGGASSKPEAAAAAASAAFDSGLQSYTAPAQQAAAVEAGGGPEAAVTEEEEEEVFVQSYKRPTQQSAAGGAGSVAQRAPPAATAGSSGTSAGLGASTAAAAAAAAAAMGAAAVGGGKRCACCGGSFAKLYRCSNCAAAGLEVGYCSAACQKSHWKAGHKKVCGKVHQ